MKTLFVTPLVIDEDRSLPGISKNLRLYQNLEHGLLEVGTSKNSFVCMKIFFHRKLGKLKNLVDIFIFLWNFFNYKLFIMKSQKNYVQLLVRYIHN